MSFQPGILRSGKEPLYDDGIEKLDDDFGKDFVKQSVLRERLDPYFSSARLWEASHLRALVATKWDSKNASKFSEQRQQYSPRARRDEKQRMLRTVSTMHVAAVGEVKILGI